MYNNTAVTPENLVNEFVRRFDSLQRPTQAGIATLIQKLLMRGFGQKPILVAMTEANVEGDEYYHGPVGRDNRLCRLTWIATDWDKFVGDNMTVEKIYMLLEKNGHPGWSDGR